MLPQPVRSDTQIQLPSCHTTDLVLLMADRHVRATTAMSDWATLAKRCVEFTEGKQWSAEALAKLEEEERPAFTFNKIGPLVRLVLGYHRNNRMDTKFLPGHDGSGHKAVADALTHLCKVISEVNQEPYVDTEVFLDGIIGGRGFYDYRLDFERNDFGEIRCRAKDPFSIKLDPEAEDYDLNSGSFVMEDRFVSIDEVEFTYGRAAAAMVSPLVRSGGYMGGIPTALSELTEEIMPWRAFGGRRDGLNPYMAAESYMANAYDPARKNIRLVDCQHYIRVMQRCFIDLETGTREPIPESWSEQRVRKVLEWAEVNYRKRNQANPIRVAVRPLRRVRWTTMVADLIVFDAWSPYESFTLIPFFPYFRRGKTRGMVEDLIDPQMEINKRRSAQIDAVTRTAHSGWMYHTEGVTEEQKQNIERNGSTPGINIEWKGQPHQKPERIQAAAPPMAMERLEQKGADDLREISGINESALGQIDRVQSGRAIEARQKQAVLSIQVYMDNMSRTKELGGRKKLELIQNHYTEERTFRTFGDNGKDVMVTINKRQASGAIANNVTEGRYSIVVDETPLASSFISAQFEEMMELAEKGILPMTPTVKSAIIDASSIPQKEAIKQELSAAEKSSGAPDPSIESAKINAGARVEVAKIASATDLAIHGIGDIASGMAATEPTGPEEQMAAMDPMAQAQQGAMA